MHFMSTSLGVARPPTSTMAICLLAVTDMSTLQAIVVGSACDVFNNNCKRVCHHTQARHTHPLVACERHAQCGDRTVPEYVGQVKCECGSVRAEHVRVLLATHRQHTTRHLRSVRTHTLTLTWVISGSCASSSARSASTRASI
jgi:hypothetical protein